MPEYKITYWPGTARLTSEHIKALPAEELARRARYDYVKAPNRAAAIRISAARYADTSDGTLVEEVLV
jgi:hypothetical protein